MSSLYPRSSARAARAAALAERSLKGGSIISFKDGQAGVEHLAFGYDDDVEARGEFGATENLSNQSFRSISNDRPPKLSRGGNPQTTCGALVRKDKDGEPLAVGAGSLIVHPLEFGAPADPLVPTEALRRLTQS